MNAEKNIKEGTFSLPQHQEKIPYAQAWKRHFSSIVFYALLIFITALILVPPFLRGLYFEKEWYAVHLPSFALFLVWWCCRFLNRERGLAFGNSPMDFAALFLVVFYLVSLTGAVHLRAAIAELLKVASYFIIYLFVRELVSHSASRERIYLFLLHALLAAGTAVAAVGLAAAAGMLEIPGLFDGTRIHSTLQYHNGSAVYLSAIFFLALGLPAFVKGWMLRPLYLGAGLLLLLTVTFTFSRGAWLALGFSSVAYILFALRGYRLRSVINLFILGAAVIFSVTPLNGLFQGKASFEAVKLLFFLLLAVIGAGFVVELCFLSAIKINRKKLAAAAVLIAGCLLFFSAPIPGSSAQSSMTDPGRNRFFPPNAAVERLLPREVLTRLSEIDFQTKSVRDRIIYFKTAQRIAGDYLWTGAGGGAWNALYLSYLEDYYPGIEYTKEEHSHYLKILLESGVPGLAAFLGLWLFLLAVFLRTRFSRSVPAEQKQLLLLIVIPAVTIGAHSAIDFGLSLGAISITLWILFALGSSFGEMLRPLMPLNGIRCRPALLYSLCAAVAVLILFLNLFTYNLFSGYLHGQRAYALLREQKIDAAVYHLEKAAAKDPYRAAYLIELAGIHAQALSHMERTETYFSLKEEALALASRGMELEPRNFNHIARYGSMLMSLGEIDKGLEQLTKLPELYPYSPGAYRYLAYIYLDTARALVWAGEANRAYDYLARIKALEETMLHYMGDADPLRFYLHEADHLLGSGESERAF